MYIQVSESERIAMIDYYENRMDITLVGSGFLGCYYFGAFSLLKHIWPHYAFSVIRGCSSGGIMAASAASDLSIKTLASHFGKFTIQAKQLMMRLGFGVTMDQIVRVMLDDLLPDNAHKLTSGRIDINLTRFPDFKNVKVSNFETKKDLLDAIVAGCFIPFWSGTIIPPLFKGIRYIDGGWAYKSSGFDNSKSISSNSSKEQQQLDSHSMTSCASETGDIKMIFCPFSGNNLDVCPDDSDCNSLLVWCFGVQMSLNYNNFVRMFNSFIPRHSSVYQQYIVQGHEDMKKCLINRNLLKCQQCYQYSNRTKSGCLRCLLLMEKVDNIKLSNEILEAYDSAARAR